MVRSLARNTSGRFGTGAAGLELQGQRWDWGFWGWGWGCRPGTAMMARRTGAWDIARGHLAPMPPPLGPPLLLHHLSVAYDDVSHARPRAAAPFLPEVDALHCRAKLRRLGHPGLRRHWGPVERDVMWRWGGGRGSTSLDALKVAGCLTCSVERGGRGGIAEGGLFIFPDFLCS